VTFLNMSIEDAAKIVISGGMVAPDQAVSSAPRGISVDAALAPQALSPAPAPAEVAQAMRRAARVKPRSRR